MMVTKTTKTIRIGEAELQEIILKEMLRQNIAVEEMYITEAFTTPSGELIVKLCKEV